MIVQQIPYIIGEHLLGPEAGDNWECPLHAANLFAGGHAAIGYYEAYRKWGDEKYLDKAIKINPRYKPSYYLVARIYEVRGMQEQAQQMIEYVNSLP